VNSISPFILWIPEGTQPATQHPPDFTSFCVWVIKARARLDQFQDRKKWFLSKNLRSSSYLHPHTPGTLNSTRTSLRIDTSS
jgi:hypothetical protein